MPSKTTSALIGGGAMLALGTVFSLLQFVIPNPAVGVLSSCLSCAGLLVGGGIAVWHYTKTHGVTLTGGQGVALGAQAGLIAAVLGFVLLLLVWLFMGMPSVSDMIAPMIDRNPQITPEQRDQVLAIYDSPIALVMVAVVSLIAYAVAGLIGGAIGAAVFKRGGDVRPEQTY